MDISLARWSGENYRCWPSFLVEPPPSGVVIVRGRNLDSPTTSGVGKTSLLAALSSLLGVGPPATKATAWGSKRYALRGEFLLGDKSLAISRSDKLRLEFGGERLEGDLAEEKLSLIFGSLKVLAPLIWRRQRKRGHFFAKTAGERATFLSEVLDLGAFERAGRSAKTAAEAASTKLAGVLGRLRHEEEASKLPPIQIIPPPDLGPLASMEEEVAVMIAAEEKAAAPHREAVRLHQGRVKYLDEIRAEISALEGIAFKVRTAAKLASGICPTCSSQVPRRDSLQLQSQLSEVEGMLADRRSVEQAVKAEVASVPIFRRDPSLSAKLAGLRAAREARERAMVASARSEEAARQRDALVASSASAIEALRRDSAALKEASSLESDVAAWEKSWRTAYAAELLADLTSETNAILSCVPNVSAVTVRFFPKETPSGAQEIVDEVLVGGTEREDGLSDGQQSSVELACDLALRLVVGGRCANRPKWMVLDEPFEGMGLRDREAFMEWMDGQQDLFLVVDTHSREFSEAFADRGVGVEMERGRSRIVSAEERASW